MPSRCVTLPSHGDKMSSLHPLHFLAMLHPVTSPLESKLKHWICTTAVGNPPQTARHPPSIVIKRSSQPWPLSPPLNRVSMLPPPEPKHHAIRAPPAAVNIFHRYLTPIVSLHNDTHDDDLADPLFRFPTSFLVCELSYPVFMPKLSTHHMHDPG
jgi:hypothetical protein